MVASGYVELNNTCEDILANNISKRSSTQNSLVPVKMGSNKMFIRLKLKPNKMITARDLIELVLMKCKVITNETSKMISTYTVFESFKGIERMVEENENIIDLISNWNQFGSKNAKKFDEQTCFEFIIRKLQSIEKRALALSKRNMKSIENQAFIKNCYKKLKIDTEMQPKTSNEPNNTELVQVDQIKNLKKRKATESEKNYVKKFKQLIHVLEHKLTTKQFVDMMFEKCKKQTTYLKEKAFLKNTEDYFNLENSKVVLIDSEIF